MIAFTLRIISLALTLHAVAARDGFEYRAKHRAHGNSTLQSRKTWALADKYNGQDFLECVERINSL